MNDAVDFRTVKMGGRPSAKSHGLKIERYIGVMMERLNNLEHAENVLFDIVRRKSVEGIEVEKALREVSEVSELKYLLK